MARTIAIGVQDFETLIRNNCFYIDKTEFIKEWWEKGDDVTLITRPRRFGKTLTISMLDYFFPSIMQAAADCLKTLISGNTRNAGNFKEVILSCFYLLPVLKKSHISLSNIISIS